MENGRTLCPVFCTADIPTTILDNFLILSNDTYMKLTGSLVSADPDPPVSHIILTAADLSNITKGTCTPVQSFVSPFLGKNIDQIKAWFKEHITEPRRDGFMAHCFIVLDEQTLEDESCLFVCTQDEPPDSLRCDFDLAMQNAVTCDMGDSIQEGLMGSFMRSGVIMTPYNLELAKNKGCYIEDGEVKQNESWKEFSKW